MAKKINITESKLIKLIEHEMRNQMRDVDIDDIDIDDEDEDYDDDYESKMLLQYNHR